MFTLGGYDTRIQPDDWTVVTPADGSLAAHFEHSIAVTENGPEIHIMSLSVAGIGQV